MVDAEQLVKEILSSGDPVEVQVRTAMSQGHRLGSRDSELINRPSDHETLEDWKQSLPAPAPDVDLEESDYAGVVSMFGFIFLLSEQDPQGFKYLRYRMKHPGRSYREQEVDVGYSRGTVSRIVTRLRTRHAALAGFLDWHKNVADSQGARRGKERVAPPH